MRNGQNLRFAVVENHNCCKLLQPRTPHIKVSAYFGGAMAQTRRKAFAAVGVSDCCKLLQTAASEGRCRSGIYNPLKGVYITTTAAAFGPKLGLRQGGAFQ